MKTLGSFVRTPALLATACVLLGSGSAQAVVITTNGTGETATTSVWICLAVFVLGTLGVAFWKSKWREAE
jgi:preprotein translocase subunit SecG